MTNFSEFEILTDEQLEVVKGGSGGGKIIVVDLEGM